MLAGGLHGIEQGLSSSRSWSATPTTPTSRTSRRPCADARERVRRLRGRPVVLRRRGRRPLRQHGRRRAGGLRRRGHRLGAAPAVRAAVRARHAVLHGRQPRHRAAGHRRPARRPRPTTDAAIARVPRGLPGLAGRRARASGRALLRRFAAVVDAHVEELAELEVRNSGHTWGNARWEAGNVRDCLNYYSGAPERMSGKQIPVAGGTDITFYEPLGVVGIIVPWNFPMPIAGWGFAPALAAGNTVVLKPAEITPLTAMRLGELALEAGLPEHVLTVLPGKGSVVGERFVTHELVRKVVLHRLHRGRQAGHGRLRRAGEAGDPRARRQELQHRLRGRRHRRRGRLRAVRRLRQRRPGLLRPVADPGRAVGVRRVPGRAREVGRGAAGARPVRRGLRDGAAGLVRAEGLGPGLPRRGRGRVRRLARRTAPGGGSPPSVRHGRRPGDPDLARGGVRPGRGGDAVRRRGGRRRQGQRHRVRPVRLDLHQRPRPRAAGRPRRRGRQPQRQLATPRSATGRRSAATSSPASAASSGRTPRSRSPRRRTSSSHTEPRRQRTNHGRTHPGPGRGHHRRLLGHRSGDRQAVRRGGRQARHRRRQRRGRRPGRRGARRAPTWRRTSTST